MTETFPIYATINNNDPDEPRVQLEVRDEEDGRFRVYVLGNEAHGIEDTGVWGRIGHHDPIAALRASWGAPEWGLEIEPTA